MKTKILTVCLEKKCLAIEEAVFLLSKGEVVAIPTETVYGLAANALDDSAMKKIYQAKNRPQDNPLIIHVLSLEMVSVVVDLAAMDDEKKRLLKHLSDSFWPGPLTLVLPKKKSFSILATCGQKTVAVRIPSGAVMRRIIEKCGFPLAAPSANNSTLPSATEAKHVFCDMKGKIPLVLDGGASQYGIESTILSLSGEVPVVLRKGALSVEKLRSICGRIMILEKNEEEKVYSPGLKHKHYSPRAHVILIEDGEKQIEQIKKIFLEKKTCSKCKNLYCKKGLLCSEDVFNKIKVETELRKVSTYILGLYRNSHVEIAQNLFSGLRSMDEQGVCFVILCGVSEDGLGSSVMDRMRRASDEKFFVH